jgi:peptide/nickel transport system substrate-binding protein
MNRRTFAAGVPAALGACSLSASGPRVRSHVLRWTDGLDVPTLNPFLSTTTNITFLSQLTMALFTRFDAAGNPIPELVSTIPTRANGGISPNGRAITWHLRPNLRWSDGAPLGAADVLYTLAVTRNPANNIALRAAWDHIEGAEAPDERTVVFHLKAPFAPFYAECFGSPSASCVLPKHILAPNTLINAAPYNALPVGAGPFRYTAFRRADVVEMEANPYYFRGLPKLHRIVYKIITDENTLYAQLQSGELDLWSYVSGTFYDRVGRLAGKRVVSVPSPFISGIYFNVARPVVRETTVRRALRLATDRALIFDRVFHRAGTIAQSVVSRIARDFDATLPLTPYDPAEAQRLLESAGWRRGPDGTRSKGGVPLEVQLAIPSGYPPSALTAEILRTNWSAVGARLELHAYDTGKYFAPYASGGILQTGKFDAALLSVPTTVFADISNFYACAYAPPRGFNFMRYCNPLVDADLAAYLADYDPRAARELAGRFQRRIDDDVPVIVLYERANINAFDARLVGFRPPPAAPFDDFMNVDI